MDRFDSTGTLHIPPPRYPNMEPEDRSVAQIHGIQTTLPKPSLISFNLLVLSRDDPYKPSIQLVVSFRGAQPGWIPLLIPY